MATNIDIASQAKKNLKNGTKVTIGKTNIFKEGDEINLGPSKEQKNGIVLTIESLAQPKDA